MAAGLAQPVLTPRQLALRLGISVMPALVGSVDGNNDKLAMWDDSVGANVGITPNEFIAGADAVFGRSNLSTATAVTVVSAAGTIDETGVTVDASDNMLVPGNLTINGDLLVATAGQQVILDTETVTVEDPLLELARGNVANLNDIGIYGTYNDGTQKYGGLFRDATDGKWRLFADLTVAPTTTVDTAGAGYAAATLVVGSLETANADVTGGTIAGITDLAVADGGTGASTESAARTNLGLDDMATQAANAVAITGGTIAGITDLAVADGGTGASTESAARTNLGLGTMATQAANNVAITGGSVAASALSYTAATTLIISSGSVTYAQPTHIIAAESGTADDLTTISVSGTTAKRLIIWAATGHTITIKHDADNIVTASGSDFELSGNTAAELVYDNAISKWRLVSGGASSGGGAGSSGIGPEWESFTPTGSWTSNVTYTGYYRHIGDELHIRYHVDVSGAPTSTTLDLNLPSGFNLDTTKILTTEDFVPNVGRGNARDSSASYIYPLFARLDNIATTPVIRASRINPDGSEHILGSVSATAPFIFASGDEIWLEAMIPVTSIGSLAGDEELDTTETATFQVDENGDRIYHKRISLGTLPNSTTATTTHGITSLDAFQRIQGVCDDGTDTLPLPFVDPGAIGSCIGIYADGTNVTVKTGSDRTSFSGVVDLYYTKT